MTTQTSDEKIIIHDDFSELGVDLKDISPLAGKSWMEQAEYATKVAVRHLETSSKFKEPLMEKTKLYENMYLGKLPKKLRVQFNVALPIFSGMVDTLCSDFDEPIELDFKEAHPADYFKAKKIKAAFDMSKNSTKPADKWDYKMRAEKKIAIMSGRGIRSLYSESDPEFKTVLEILTYEDFHCQPDGGGILENHLWAYQENVFRSKADLVKGAISGRYNKEAVKLLIERAGDKEYQIRLNRAVDSKLNKFKAYGLDDGNNYVGEEMFNLVKGVLTLGGVRYYILFDAFTVTPIRFCPLKEVFSSNLMPWMSWATHEELMVFWSKSFADDFYPIADSAIALFNQELTNREKKNLGARAYDKDMFPEPDKLDAAQYRADALVPADTKGGTRKISEGIYRFDTAELGGTINLVDWLTDTAGKNIGVTDTSQGGEQKASKRVGVIFQEKDALAKRIGWRANSYSECNNEMGIRFIQCLKDDMPASMAIRMLGEDGYEWEEITRMDLNTEKDIEVYVTSSANQIQESNIKKQNRVKSIEMISNDPEVKATINKKWMGENILREVGGYEEDEIKDAFDLTDYGGKESKAYADMAIHSLLRKQEPKIHYDADTKFLSIILDYMKKHREKLQKDDLYLKFSDYMQKHTEIVTENMAKRAIATKRDMAMKQAGAGADKPTAPETVTPPTNPNSSTPTITAA